MPAHPPAVRIACLLMLGALCAPSTLFAAPPTTTTGGKLLTIDGITVLRVHGDAAQRGRAHGYLLAPEIISLIDGYLGAAHISGGPQRYEATMKLMQNMIVIAPRYMEELTGMLAGIEERLAGETTIPALGRRMTLADLVAINCVPDAVGFGCSSFSAWKTLTPQGHTITGRNLDWHTIDALRENQIVIAHLPPKDADEAAWMSVTWPGLVVCLTGMNEHGVTVAMHDVHVDSPKVPANITPRGYALREAIETARAESCRADVHAVLKRCRALVGNNVHVTNPYDGEFSPSRVFEYDGFLRDQNGVTVRNPRSCIPRTDRRLVRYQVTTNHYRCRSTADECTRYQTLDEKLRSLATAPSAQLDVNMAWELLKSVAVAGRITTYQSVVFEPNARRMHVSFSTKSEAAPNGRRVTLDVAGLLARPHGRAVDRS